MSTTYLWLDPFEGHDRHTALVASLTSLEARYAAEADDADRARQRAIRRSHGMLTTEVLAQGEAFASALRASRALQRVMPRGGP